MSRAMKKDSSLVTLTQMLSTRRPANSNAERKWIKKWIAPHNPRVDGFGNQIIRIGTAPVLWSAHTDTVHKKGGGQQVTNRMGLIRLVKSDRSNCLGADDGAGVWLLLEMIKAKREGLYIFHRAEEVGGLGSDYIANDTPGILDGIQWAIAFDRKGQFDVITEQWGGRCCSDDFALALCSKLNMGHSPDPTGVFTDTANYTDLIPECCNVSVGYEREHSKLESLDSSYLFELRDRMLELDVSDLPVIRDPADRDTYDDLNWYGGGRNYSQGESLLDLVKDYPATAARLLEECSVDARDFSRLWDHASDGDPDPSAYFLKFY